MMDVELLEASILGALSPALEEEVEEHLLACGACADVYERLLALGAAIRALVTRGEVWVHATAELEARLVDAGLLKRRYTLRPGDTVACTVDATDVYSLATYHADVTGVTRVDVFYADRRLEDVPFGPDGTVRMLAPGGALRKLPTSTLPVRLVAVADDGSERTLGAYALDHTAYAPT